MLCVNKLGLNWALRTQGSGAGPTWTLSRVFKEPFPPLEAAATEITREDSGSEEEPPRLEVWTCECVSVECMFRGAFLCTLVPRRERGERKRKLRKLLKGTGKRSSKPWKPEPGTCVPVPRALGGWCPKPGGLTGNTPGPGCGRAGPDPRKDVTWRPSAGGCRAEARPLLSPGVAAQGRQPCSTPSPWRCQAPRLSCPRKHCSLPGS